VAREGGYLVPQDVLKGKVFVGLTGSGKPVITQLQAPRIAAPWSSPAATATTEI